MMPTYLTHKNILLATIALVLFIVLFSHLNTVELRAEEPRRAIVAMEMNITGEYIVPRINGWNYYNKPPLFNWLMVLCFKIFGSYETWVVRIPSLISFLLCGLANYFFIKRYLSKETAILSSLFFLSAGDLLFYGTQVSGEIDLFFTLMICLQVMLMYHFFRQQQFLLMFVASYILAAAGVLTKGPPAVLFQGITLIVLIAYYNRWRLLFSWQHLAGAACFIIITGSYFYAYAQQQEVTPYIINLFKEASEKSGLGNQSIKLFTSFISYPFLLLQWLLPWSLFGIYFFSKKTISAIRAKEFLVFLVLFILANIPFYWLTTNPKSRYIYMFIPFIMVLLTYAYLERKKDWPKITKGIMLLFTIVIMILPVAALSLPWLHLGVPVNHAVIKSLIVVIPSTLIAWFYWRYKTKRLYYFLLSLLMIRLLINFFYLPTLRQSSNALTNLEHFNTIQTITNHEPLFLSGEPYTQVNKLEIGPFNIASSNITTAPQISYILPYYYTKETGRILRFEETMRQDTWYLIYKEAIRGRPVKVYYSYEEPWTKHEMALVRLN